MHFPVHYTTVTHQYAESVGFSVDEMGEFDDPDVIACFENLLSESGYSPIRIPCESGAGGFIKYLITEKPRVVWNMNAGLFGYTREAQVPLICEFLGIPFTGAGSWTAFITQDKALTYEYLKGRNLGIAFPEHVLIETAKDLALIERIPFDGPYFIKPNFEGSSRGILPGPVFDQNSLKTTVSDVLEKWGPVLIQKFIYGIDISSNLLCDPNWRLQALEPLFINSGGDDSSIFTSKLKTTSHEMVRYEVLRNVDEVLSKNLKRISTNLGEILKFRHYARFDFRVEPDSGKIYFLEANLCPSFAVDGDFGMSVRYSGITFHEMVRNILKKF